MAETMTPREGNDRVAEVAVAVAHYAADLLQVSIDAQTVRRAAIAQLDLDIFDEPLLVGEVAIDSLALVELLATFEAELGVPLFEQDDVEGISTLRGLSTLALDQAPAELLEEFLATWAIEPVDA